jgi:hypothetical protein
MVLTTTTLFGWLFLKSIVHFPDGYAIDAGRDSPRYAMGVDRDNIVSIDIPTTAIVKGGALQLRFDTEDRAFGPDADSLMLRFKWKY